MNIIKIAILFYLVFYSCSELRTQEREEPKQILKENEEMEIISIDEIQQIFIQCAMDNLSFFRVTISDRVKRSYVSVEPLDACEKHHVVRVVNKKETKWIDLIIYEFENNEFDQAFSRVKPNSAQEEILFGKDWDKIFGVDNVLIRINGGCTVSQKEWTRLISEFYKNIDNTMTVYWKGIECKCGLPCWKLSSPHPIGK